MAVAITLFCLTLVGGGFGPLVTGAISDALKATQGVDSLRCALMAMMPVRAVPPPVPPLKVLCSTLPSTIEPP